MIKWYSCLLHKKKIIACEKEMRPLGRCGRRRRKNRRIADDEKISPQSHDVAFVGLQKWLKRTTKTRHVEFHRLQPCNFPDTGRGMRAMKSFKSGDCIVSIPHHILITVGTVFKHDIGVRLMKYESAFTPQQVLTLFLAMEKLKGDSSSWSAYIQTLPGQYSTPLYFSSAEVNLLKGKTKQLAETSRARFSEACQEMLSFIRDTFPSVSSIVDRHILQWAWSTIDTRSVYLETQPHPSLNLKAAESNVALAPFLDMLNHRDDVQIKAGLNRGSNCYEIITKNAYNKYDQVFISYGPHDNSKLLLNYGFTLPHNIHNGYTFSRDDVRICFPQLEHWDRKMSLLQECELDKGLVCTMEGPSWSLMTALKILALPWEHLTSWKNLFLGNIINEENEACGRQMAKRLIQDALWEAKRHEKAVRTHPQSHHKDLILRLAVDDVDILELSLKVLSDCR